MVFNARANSHAFPSSGGVRLYPRPVWESSHLYTISIL